jgi:aminopeptidase YwaD
MTHDTLRETAESHLHSLCNLTSRAVGSEGNRYAVDWFAQAIRLHGFAVETPCFPCMYWSSEGATVTAGSVVYSAHSSPYAQGCDVRAPLVVVGTMEELEAARMRGKVVLLHGEIAGEQLMPKSFAFYSVPEHQHIYSLLEASHPAVIITATGKNPNMAGAVYPFPMFEDGDFDIPSVYMTDLEGASLARRASETVHVISKAVREPSTACNVVARRAGRSDRRIVVMAHIDAKNGTPGALDDGGGITTLLLLAELLKDYDGQHMIELVAVNGEDYYSAPGEMDYLRCNEGKFHTLSLGINLDGVGYIEGHTAYSLYGCPAELTDAIRAGLASYEGLCEGESWYQGDHVLMVSHGRPALALTSERAMELLATIIHTERDTVDKVDSTRLVEAAHALREVIWRVDMLEP